MKEYLSANRAVWDAWTPFHVRSKVYDIDAFKAGADALDMIEIAGVGDVRGKRLLHLQCHFGLGTLSWARRGAKATGTDFSANAVEAARALAAETGIEARFVHSDLYHQLRHTSRDHMPNPARRCREPHTTGTTPFPTSWARCCGPA